MAAEGEYSSMNRNNIAADKEEFFDVNESQDGHDNTITQDAPGHVLSDKRRAKRKQGRNMKGTGRTEVTLTKFQTRSHKAIIYEGQSLSYIGKWYTNKQRN